MNYLINYISIFLGTYSIYILNIFYNELILKEPIEIGIKGAFQFYGLIAFVEGFLLLILIYIFFNFIYKIKLKNITIYFLILFITLFYLIFLHIFNNENPIYTFIFYTIGIGLYGYYLKNIKKVK